jgi:hypothetical protein
VPALHRQVLLPVVVGQVDAVGNAGTVGDDQRRPGVRLGLEEGLQHLRVLGAVGHVRHVDVGVLHGQQGQVLLATALPAAENLATAPRGVALEVCPPVLE